MSGLNAVKLKGEGVVRPAPPGRRSGGGHGPSPFTRKGFALTAEGGSPDQKKKGCTGEKPVPITARRAVTARGGSEARCLWQDRAETLSGVRFTTARSPGATGAGRRARHTPCKPGNDQRLTRHSGQRIL